MAQEFSESELSNPDENGDDSINDLLKKAYKLSEDIKEQDRQDLQEFQKKAEMVYSKVEQTVKSLRGAADKLDQVCRDRQKAHAVGAAGGVVSGLITLGVTAMTGGAASPLLLATGMGFGVVGAAINWGSSRIETATNSQFLQTSIQATGAAGQACAQVADDIAQATAGAAGAAGQACAQVADDIAQASAGAGGAAGQACTQVAEDVAQATGTAGAAGQAGGKVGVNVSREVLFVGNVAFLMSDALDLHYTIRDILKNKGSEAAKRLREKANELEATMKQ